MVEWWEFLSADKESLSIQTEVCDYDPRTRKWYMEAQQKGRLTLTRPYIFTTSRELGLTCTVPMANGKGVVSVNIMLRNFRDMLTELKPSTNGQIFLLDMQQRVIAGTINSHNSIRQLDTTHLRPLEEHNLHSPELLSVLLSSTSDEIHIVEEDGENFLYLCDVIEIGDSLLTLLILAPLKDFTGFANNFLSTTMLFAILSLLFIMPPVWFFSRRLSISLQQLQERAMEVKKGIVAYEHPIKSHIFEVERLSRTLRFMRGSIRRRTQELLEIQRKQEDLVTERTAELVQARDQAEQATLAKSAFISTMSHEMRTPLNAVIGFTHLFNRTGLEEKQISALEKIRIASEQLLYIINDVLDFSKIEAGKLAIEIIPFQPRALVDSVISVVSFSAHAKHLCLTAHISDDVPRTLLGDPNRLRQILLNLLNNAVKFTNMGCITLEIRINNAVAEYPHNVLPVYFSVSDTGIGIEPEQLNTIFQPFMQADNTISRRFGGTGLGLSICRHLIKRMGGNIQVTSKVGQGTTFFFTLPMRTEGEGNEVHENHETGLPPLPASRLAARILIVEDNAINREIATAMLENLGLENIDTAENGGDALRNILVVPYELVFMDMQMPVMDGLAVTRAVRDAAETDRKDSGRKPSRPWLQDLPIIAMTGNAMAEDRKRCLDAGMDDHISKPLMPDVLHALLLRWLPDRQ